MKAKRACPHCGGKPHGLFYEWCDAALTAFLDDMQALREGRLRVKRGRIIRTERADAKA